MNSVKFDKNSLTEYNKDFFAIRRNGREQKPDTQGIKEYKICKEKDFLQNCP